jgi:hypothetical protein
VEGGAMQLRPWYGCRERHVQKLTVEAAEDIIRNCKRKEQDAEFAAKYKIVTPYVAEIRLGRHWQWLRREIEGK